MTLQDSITLDAMETYGGSFIRALAQAARKADAVNLEKIKVTWPDEWERYTYAATNQHDKEA